MAVPKILDTYATLCPQTLTPTSAVFSSSPHYVTDDPENTIELDINELVIGQLILEPSEERYLLKLTCPYCVNVEFTWQGVLNQYEPGFRGDDQTLTFTTTVGDYVGVHVESCKNKPKLEEFKMLINLGVVGDYLVLNFNDIPNHFQFEQLGHLE